MTLDKIIASSDVELQRRKRALLAAIQSGNRGHTTELRAEVLLIATEQRERAAYAERNA